MYVRRYASYEYLFVLTSTADDVVPYYFTINPFGPQPDATVLTKVEVIVTKKPSRRRHTRRGGGTGAWAPGQQEKHAHQREKFDNQDCEAAIHGVFFNVLFNPVKQLPDPRPMR